MNDGTYAYVLVITDDGRLEVNGTTVPAPAHVSPGDSEGLLAWALDATADQHATLNAPMSLTVRDQRQGGYGLRSVTVIPGVRVDIESLRAAARKVYAKPALTVATSPAQAAPALASPVVGSAPARVAPVAAPARATGAAATADGSKVSHARSVSVPTSRTERRPAAPTVEPSRDVQQTAAADVVKPPVPGWILAAPTIPRPVLVPRDEQPRVPRWIKVAAVAGVLAVAAGGVTAARVLAPDVYARVCVDTRIDQRVAHDESCDSGSAYYSWWYVPEGGEVPAVAAAPVAEEGSFTAPKHDNAPVSTGFAESGGVVVGPERGD